MSDMATATATSRKPTEGGSRKRSFPTPTPTPTQHAAVPTWQTFAFPSFAAAVVTPFTNKFAVAKTHLQAKGAISYRGMTDFFRHAIAVEGPPSLQRGIVPVAMREASMNVFRIGLYPHLLSSIHDETRRVPAPAAKRMVAGACSGAVGFFACNPFEIVRVRMQAMPIGSPVSFLDMTRRILVKEGVAGFYRAGGASVALGVVQTSVNLTTYTLLRERAVPLYGETTAVDVACALVSGFLSALAMNPVDVVRTRLWTQPSSSSRSSSPLYEGGFHAASVIWKQEGASAFLRGFVPSFLRVGPHFVLTFALLEQLKRSARRRNADESRYPAEALADDLEEDGIDEVEQSWRAPLATSAWCGADDADRLSKEIFAAADHDDWNAAV